MVWPTLGSRTAKEQEQEQEHLRRVCGSRPTRNAEFDIKWSSGLGTTAVVTPAVQRPPLQLILSSSALHVTYVFSI